MVAGTIDSNDSPYRNRTLQNEPSCSLDFFHFDYEHFIIHCIYVLSNELQMLDSLLKNYHKNYF